MIPKKLLLATSLACSVGASATSHAADCTSNLMIVLDRSCSMTSNSIMGKTRWDIAVDAINKLMSKNSTSLRFGLAMFPNKTTTSGMCVQNSPLLAPATGNNGNVSAQLTANRPDAPCVTNIDEGVKQAAAEQSLYATERRSFVLLITDGEQSNNCNGGTTTADPKTNQYIQELYNKKVPTYVVGFDIGSNMKAQTSLNSFAVSGGLPNTAGTTKYYPANNQAELEATLDKLAGQTGGEVSLCRGMPCPDGRCLSATATCTEGFCVEPVPPPGGGGEEPVDPNGSGTVSTGCACQLGGISAAPPAGLLALALGGALTLFGRRRKRAQ